MTKPFGDDQGLSEDLYLLPALLHPQDNPHKVPLFAPPGLVRLERKFKLDQFTPPSLLQRIIAKTLRHFVHHRDLTRHEGRDQEFVTTNCWRTALRQEFLSAHRPRLEAWVWIDSRTRHLRVAGISHIMATRHINKQLDIYCSIITDILSTFPVRSLSDTSLLLMVDIR
jgi:hypothetical protein